MRNQIRFLKIAGARNTRQSDRSDPSTLTRRFRFVVRFSANALIYSALVFAASRLHAEEPAAAPPVGSNLPLAQNRCAACHGEKELWEGENARFYVPIDQLADELHFKNGINCHDCHGGDPTTTNFKQAHAAEVDRSQSQATPFRTTLIEKTASASRLQMVVDICGKCHAGSVKTYLASVHGQGWQGAGLIVSATCTDCHGNHSMFKATDPRSQLNVANVGNTCAKCHRFILERLQKSVHGSATPPAQTKAAINVEVPKRKPICTDCHQGHDLPQPKSAAFRAGLANRCGTCHANLSNTFNLSLHGELTDFGYVPAAKCSDCHGAHDILPVADPGSRMSVANRATTCGRCHENATGNFLNYDPHANPRDQANEPILYWINQGLTWMLISVFSIFGLHSVLWCIRSLPYVMRHGRPSYPKPGTHAYRRFTPIHRMAHAVLMTSFLGLALTGLPLEFGDYAWAHALSWLMGGFASTGLWHRIFGIMNVCCLLFYLFYFAWRIIAGPKSGISRIQYIFGPDSPVPNPRDFVDFAKNLRWFVGLGPRPTFERWSYWEKFDLWAASCDIVLIGTTGLILWFPNLFCTFLPGIAVNIADLIHGKLALLATGFVFSIHFFSSNLRPEKFPMDISILTGLVSEEEMEEERPELVKRLKQSGQLDQHLVETPSRLVLLLHMLGGAAALSIGLALLVAIVVALFQ